MKPGDLIVNTTHIKEWDHKPMGFWSNGTVTWCDGMDLSHQPGAFVALFLGMGEVELGSDQFYAFDLKSRMIVLAGSDVIDIAGGCKDSFEILSVGDHDV